jgi:hypothetical protein
MLHEFEHPHSPSIISESGVNVCYWHKADIELALRDVRFWVNSGHRMHAFQCLLLTHSGHRTVPLFDHFGRLAFSCGRPLSSMSKSGSKIVSRWRELRVS